MTTSKDIRPVGQEKKKGVVGLDVAACSSKQRVCNDSIARDQLLVCPGLNSTEVSATLIATPLMLIALNIMVHRVAGMLIL